jgi:Golgi nucleoside diphosphatase
MFAFYSVIIIFGIFCIIFALIILVYDRKKMQFIATRMEEKKEELIEAIDNAEQMVIEMNNFQDFLFERVDSKTKEFEKIIESAKIVQKERTTQKERIIQEEKLVQEERIIQGEFADVVNGGSYYFNNFVKVSRNIKNNNKTETAEVVKKELPKVIHLNPKHKEAYILHEKGRSELEIAKMLNMGVGEVKLILGVNR